jgi:hypothetical protein
VCLCVNCGQDVYLPALVAGSASAVCRSHSNLRVTEAGPWTLCYVWATVIMTPTVARAVPRRRVTGREYWTTPPEHSYMRSVSAYVATYSRALLRLDHCSPTVPHFLGHTLFMLFQVSLHMHNPRELTSLLLRGFSGIFKKLSATASTFSSILLPDLWYILILG